MEDHKHIPIEGIEGHITWTGKEPPSEEVLAALNDMAKKAYNMFELTPRQLEIRNCDHVWKSVNSGYCSDCIKCGYGI